MAEEGTVQFLLHSLLEVLNISNCPGFEKGGFLETMLTQTPLIYHGALLVSFGAVFLAWFYTSREKEIQESDDDSNESKEGSCTQKEGTSGEKPENGNTQSKVSSFEISPSDECEFIPLVSYDEDRRTAAELAPKTKYIPLDPNNPSAQVNKYLNKLRGENDKSEEESGDSDDNSEEDEVLEKAANFGTEDWSQYISPKDLHDDPRESPSRRGNLISRVKKAKQRAIRNAVEKDMTADDHLREQMAANQMLSRVFTMMRENKQLFGDNTSFEDVKTQMDLYKA